MCTNMKKGLGVSDEWGNSIFKTKTSSFLLRASNFLCERNKNLSWMEVVIGIGKSALLNLIWEMDEVE